MHLSSPGLNDTGGLPASWGAWALRFTEHLILYPLQHTLHKRQWKKSSKGLLQVYDFYDLGNVPEVESGGCMYGKKDSRMTPMFWLEQLVDDTPTEEEVTAGSAG